jgi:hypothetical protein
MKIVALLALVPALAFGQASPSAVVKALYDDFPASADPTVMQQPRSVLDKYFAPLLAEAIESDARCVESTREVCRLDFVPQWDSNDPAATDLQIGNAVNGVVQVRFNYPGKTTPISLSYVLVETELGWRISDIRAADWALSEVLAVRSR